MAKTKSSTPDVAAKPGIHPEVRGFLDRLTGDPAFKRMNPGVQMIDGRLEYVAPPPVKVPPLRDPGGKRRADAVIEVTYQVESLFGALIDFLDREDDGGDFDEAVMLALAIRGHDLNSALMSHLSDQISTRELEGLVYRGAHPTYDDEPDGPVTKSAKSKPGRRNRKVAAAA